MNLSSNVINTEAALDETLEYFLSKPAFAYDIETSGENRGVPSVNNLSWIGLATYGKTALISFDHPVGTRVVGEAKEPRMQKNGVKWFRIPVYEPPPPQLDRAMVMEKLRPLLFSNSIVKVAHGAQFDLASLAKYYGGELPSDPVRCTIVLQWLLNENLNRYGLKYRTKDVYGFSYDDENVGKQVEKHPYNMVAHYLHCDVTYTWLEYLRLKDKIDQENLAEVFALENKILRITSEMRLTGIRVDVDRLMAMKGELKEKTEFLEGEIYRAAGQKFNIKSYLQKQKVLFEPKSRGGQGLKPWKLTEGAKEKERAAKRSGTTFTPALTDWSTDAAAIEGFSSNPVVSVLLKYQDVSKILTTYVLGYLGDPDEGKPCRIYGDRIYAEPVQYGAATGRYCVSGDTLLPTSRGTFRFDEYVPKKGDTVISHLGNECKVLGKVYKGLDKMFRVTLYDGTEVKCTGGHRLWTPDGWKHVRDLRPEDKVTCYVGVKVVHVESREHQSGDSSLLRESAQANDASGCRASRDNLSQCSWDFETTVRTHDVEGRAEASVFSFQDARQESYEGKIGRSASQLQGRDFGRTRLSSNKGGREVYPSPSARDGAGAGAREASSLVRRSSYRRGHIQQRYRQSGVSDYIGARQATCQEVKIREITPLGTMGVWDIEVEGDHSYRAQGMIHHNSYRDPNLQNVPAPDPDDPDNLSKIIRQVFLADDGYKLVVADYSQIELVILAHYLGQGALFDGFIEGIDPHTVTAARIRDKKPSLITQSERKKYGKSPNFAVTYGAGITKLASMIGGTKEEAKRVLKKHQEEFPEIYAFRSHVLGLCAQEKQPHVRTLLGRKRRVPKILSSDPEMRAYAERQAFNAIMQGGSADLIKMAQCRYEELKKPGMRQLLTVHDEIVTAVPDGMIEEGKKALREAMVGDAMQALISVPLNIDMAVVDRWSEAK